ncbi:MAG: hypothetical protein RLZZ350_9, partial [Verrucomicrobiota bacterium]
DWQSLALQPGQRILIEGDNASPWVATYPDYPNRLTTNEWRDLFESPPNRGINYATRMRGFLHPPTTGKYTFWIASDNSSELWLSQSSDPAAAKRIAYIEADKFSKPREWARLPTQKSEKIFLEADKSYFIEAVYEQSSGYEHLAVAWEGPSLSQSVIEGGNLSPWLTDAANHTNGIVWEYFTNYPACTVRPLTTQAETSILTLKNLRVTKLGYSELPEVQPIQIAQPLAAKDNFCWAEVEGTVEFVAKSGSSLVLELVEQQRRMTVFVQAWPEAQAPRWQNLRVKVRGVCEATIAANGEKIAGMIYSPSAANVSTVGSGAELWSSMAATPICNIDPTDPSLAWGRKIMVRGTVVQQKPGQLLIQGADSFYGYVSSNGVNWIQAAPPIEIVVSNSMFAGLTASSFNTNTLATATFEHVAGLAASARDARINNNPLLGRASFDGSTTTLIGGGRGFRGRWDQLEYLYGSLAEGGELVARLDRLEADDPQARAGIMFRESLSHRSPMVSLDVSLTNSVLLHYRQEYDLNSVAVTIPGLQIPCWLKLAHRHSFLTAQGENFATVKIGQPVELVGFLTWENGQPVLVDARCRATDGEKESPVVFSMTAASNQSAGEPGVTHIEQIISQIASQREERGDTMRLRGVLTFVGRISGRYYIAMQDETAAIFMEVTSRLMLPGLRVGQIVEIGGRRNGKTFEPRSVNIVGLGQMPKPAVHPEEYEMLRRGEGSWIQLDGIIQSATTNGTVLLMTKAGAVTALIGKTSASVLSNYVNAFVRLRGVATWVGENEMRLLVPTQSFVEVREAPPSDPFIVPTIPAASVMRFNNNFQGVHRLKVEGVVTYRQTGLMFLQDTSGGVAVRTAQAAVMQEGDQVEVVGFPQRGVSSPTLIETVVRKQKNGVLPLPAHSSLTEILQGKRDATLVQLKAVVLGQQHLSSGETVLNLETENRAFRATLTKDRGQLNDLPVGSVVQVAGVCYAERAEVPEPTFAAENEPMIAAFNLLLRQPGDVVLLQRPPWWNWKHTVAVVACLLAVLMGTLLWVHSLRRRVARRTRQLEIAMGKLEAETQISATLAERQRLAGEIHDGLEQGLSGIMMQLNGVTSTLEDKPDEARGFLELARNMVRFSHAELRHSLLNLQSPLLANADLGTALAEIAKQMKNGSHNTEIITHTIGTVRPLPPSMENHLFRIGQEAINNALKHAHAKTIQIHLVYSAASVQLSVCDDGAGFDQSAVLAGTVGQHLGLRSLRDRARKMGGQLTVVSDAGKGATIEVSVPLNYQHSDAS